MGKILDTLRQAQGLARPQPEIAAHSANGNGAPAGEARGEAGEEVPFIEVGGGGIEGSALVMASPRGRPRKPPGSASAAASAADIRCEATEGETPTAQRIPAFTAPERDPEPIAFHPLPFETRDMEPVHRRLAMELVTFHRPDHPASEQYRSLLRSMERQTPVSGPQVLTLVAAGPGAGTTHVLLNLAIARARTAKRPIVVVDANLRTPCIARRLGLPDVRGVREILAGEIPLERAIQPSGVPNLFVLTAGEGPATTYAGPASATLRAVLSDMRKRFEWVMVDAPAWDGGPELASLAPITDVVYLVLRSGEIETPAVNKLMRLIPHLRSHLGGYILSQPGR